MNAIQNESDGETPGLAESLRLVWQRSRGTISLVLVATCTVLFFVCGLLEGFRLVPRSQSLSFLGLSYAGVFQHLWLHQFVTAPLMHGGVGHLVFNMLSLWMLGPEVENHLGPRRYCLFSALCALASMLGFLLFNWGTDNIVIGYSGVIFGILVAQAVFFPNNVVALFAFFPLKMKYAVLLLGAVELYLTISPEGTGIAHAAHLFGALAAVVYLKAPNWRALRNRRAKLIPQLSRRPRAVRRRNRQDIPREL